MKRHGDEFDVIVLGSGLGGLIAAALLSYHNRRVLCLRESSYHPSFSREGYRFNPFSNFSEKRLKLSPWRAVSQALHLPSLSHDQRQGEKGEAKQDGSRERVAFQVILPRARVDLFRERSMLRMEWKREFPEELAPVEAFYNQLDQVHRLLGIMKAREDSWSVLPLRPLSLMKRWFSLKSLPREWMGEKLSLFSKEFKKFIQLQLISWCNLTSEDLPIALTSYLLLDHAGGGWASDIELERAERNIFERLIQSGGSVQEIEGVKRVDAGRWKKRFALTLKGEEKSILTRFLILNSPLHLLSPLLGKEERLLSKWRKKIRPRYAVLPLFLGIDEKVIPVGMRDLLVSLLDLEKPYEEGNLLFISISQKGDLTAAPEGKRALTVESLVPVERWEKDLPEEHLNNVMRHLDHLFPFLERHIEFSDWSWVEGQRFGWSYPHYIYETTSDFRWREGVVPFRLWKNLYFVGKENFPYMGLEGELLSGWRVGKEILNKSQ